MRVVKRSINKLVIETGSEVVEVEGPIDGLGRAKWIVIRVSPSNMLVTKTDTIERAEGLAISMVERAKKTEIHVAVGKDVGTVNNVRVYRLSTTYHWVA